MESDKVPKLKSQVELSQSTINPYLDDRGTPPIPKPKARENQRAVEREDPKPLTVGLQDIDEAIFYYFKNVIKPIVYQNGQSIELPVMYGSPEAWSAVQKDGAYRDRNGKIQAPLIMIKRDSVEKNRTLGNKLDANNPIHFGVFENRYTKKNAYGRFDVVKNREPIREFYGVVMPDFVNISYSCIIFTNFMAHMNGIIEAINYASDSYWGNPEKFQFNTVVGRFSPTVEAAQGTDRTVKTTTTLDLIGHIIPSTINTHIGNSNKFYSKTNVEFGMETYVKPKK
jgi:hypothetical protein